MVIGVTVPVHHLEVGEHLDGISHQSSVISHQSSVIRHQSSTYRVHFEGRRWLLESIRTCPRGRGACLPLSAASQVPLPTFEGRQWLLKHMSYVLEVREQFGLHQPSPSPQLKGYCPETRLPEGPPRPQNEGPPRPPKGAPPAPQKKGPLPSPGGDPDGRGDRAGAGSQGDLPPSEDVDGPGEVQAGLAAVSLGGVEAVGARPQQDAAPLGAGVDRGLYSVSGRQLAPEAARARLQHVAGRGVE